MAGHEFDGHTGLLAHLCGVDTQYMILGSPKLRVIHLTTHLSLVDALKRVKTDRIVLCARAAKPITPTWLQRSTTHTGWRRDLVDTM